MGAAEIGRNLISKVRVLLFDMDDESGAGRELRQLLEDCWNPFFKVKQHTIGILNFGDAAKQLSSVLSTARPEIGILIFNAKCRSVASEVFSAWFKGAPGRPFIVVPPQSDDDEQVDEMLLGPGAPEFVSRPFQRADVLRRISRALSKIEKEDEAPRHLEEKIPLTRFIGRSSALLTCLEHLPAIAQSNCPVLICGETGTGKEICAEAIYRLSPRVGKPYVPINCAAISATVFESHLFGHAKGAFTSAEQSSPGLIRDADGGTLLLDEINSLPLELQPKLLRVLENNEVLPVGASKPLHVDVRIIATTNENLENLVANRHFREDLLFRLNSETILMPPLRERVSDIPLLARFFIEQICAKADVIALDLSQEAMQKLLLYDWPGNVRELKSVIERAVRHCEHAVICDNEVCLPHVAADTRAKSLKNRSAEFRRREISHLLMVSQGNISQAARQGQIDRRWFVHQMHRYHIDPTCYRPQSSPRPRTLS